MRLVEVRWADAWVDTEESTPVNWASVCEVLTYGLLVRDEPTVISIAAESFPAHPDSYRGVTHIPRSLVIEIRDLDT